MNRFWGVLCFALVVLMASPSFAFNAKRWNTLSVAVWNGLETRENLQQFVGFQVLQNEKAYLNKIFKNVPEKLPKAVIEKGEIRFGNSKTRWTYVNGGIKIGGKTYKAPKGVTFQGRIQHFLNWQKKGGTASFWNFLVDEANAQEADEKKTERDDDAEPSPEVKAILEAYMSEMMRVVKEPCPGDSEGAPGMDPDKFTFKCHTEDPDKGNLTYVIGTNGAKEVLRVTARVSEDRLSELNADFGKGTAISVRFVTRDGNPFSFDELVSKQNRQSQTLKFSDVPMRMICGVKKLSEISFAFKKVCDNEDASKILREAIKMAADIVRRHEEAKKKDEGKQ